MPYHLDRFIANISPFYSQLHCSKIRKIAQWQNARIHIWKVFFNKNETLIFNFKKSFKSLRQTVQHYWNLLITVFSQILYHSCQGQTDKAVFHDLNGSTMCENKCHKACLMIILPKCQPKQHVWKNLMYFLYLWPEYAGHINSVLKKFLLPVLVSSTSHTYLVLDIFEIRIQ